MNDASTGIDKQDEAADRYAFINGDIIVASAPDTNVSGDTDPFTRPELGPWLTDPVKMAQYDGIVAAFLDRLGRSARYLTALRDWAEDNGKVLIVINPSLKWPVPADDIGSKVMWTILALMAEYELDMIKRRSADTRAKLRAEGALTGRPPYGFMVAEKEGSKHKTLTPHPDESLIVIEMFKLYLDGWTLQQIADDLMERGVPAPTWKGKPGKVWYVNTISEILRNPVAIGRQVDADGRTILRFEPIIKTTDWLAVKARMASRATRKGVPQTGSAMLTSVLFCGKCGKPMYRIGSGGYRRVKRGGKVVATIPTPETRREYYYCRKGGSFSGCGAMLQLEELHSRVSEAITGPPYGHLPHVVVTTIPGYDYAGEIEQLKMDLTDLAQNPLADDFLKRAGEIRAEIARLSELPPVPSSIETVHDGRNVADVWNGLDVKSRRTWLIEHGWRIEAHRDAEGEMVMHISGGDYDQDAQDLASIAA